MSTLHFSCSFGIRAKSVGDPWATLLKTVRKWIADTGPCPETTNAFWDAWFYRGGEWKSQKDPRTRVLTKACYKNNPCHDSDCWAAEYEHPCGDYPGCRIWRTRVGIEQFGLGQFHFNLQILYDIRAGYIGLPPAVPLPSSPKLVAKLLTSDFWECTVGTEPLSLAPKILRVGEGRHFEQLLASKDRTCPVVLLSQVYPDRACTVEPVELSRLLAGTSLVFRSETSEVDKELEYVLGRRFSCWNGMIRVYAPNLDFERKGDYKRHRFILRKDVEAWGTDKAKEIIVTGLARRSQRPRGILTPLDVERISRRRHLAELRAQQGTQPNDEWIRALEEDNDDLNQANSQFEIDKAALQERIGALADDIQRLKSDKHALKASLKEARRAGHLRDKGNLNGSLRELPKSLPQVVDIIHEIHSGRITFTERALQSANEARFHDVHAAWKTLWAMATSLYSIFFEQEGGNKESLFKDQCGIELAMTEGKLTKKNPKLMALRKDTFMGEEIDITPHVKFDDDTTRAYFCPHRKNETNIIVVGFIGHLNTAGTRRRKD